MPGWVDIEETYGNMFRFGELSKLPNRFAIWPESSFKLWAKIWNTDEIEKNFRQPKEIEQKWTVH